MKIEVNGQIENVKDGISIKEFLETKGINFNVVACELNLEIIKRAKLGETFLKAGDKLEILRMIGGG
ncbi:MAG: sulfur carrier protein ThiS [Elusimicrobiota bacterium]